MVKEEFQMLNLKERVAALNRSQSERQHSGLGDPICKKSPPTPMPIIPSQLTAGSEDIPSLIPSGAMVRKNKFGHQNCASTTTREILPPPILDRDITVSPSIRPRPVIAPRTLLQSKKSIRKSGISTVAQDPARPPALPLRVQRTSFLPDSTVAIPIAAEKTPSIISLSSPKSQTSVASLKDTCSAISHDSTHLKVIRAPTYDPTSLPRLPPSRKELAAIADKEQQERFEQRRKSRSAIVRTAYGAASRDAGVRR